MPRPEAAADPLLWERRPAQGRVRTTIERCAGVTTAGASGGPVLKYKPETAAAEFEVEYAAAAAGAISPMKQQHAGSLAAAATMADAQLLTTSARISRRAAKIPKGSVSTGGCAPVAPAAAPASASESLSVSSSSLTSSSPLDVDDEERPPLP